MKKLEDMTPTELRDLADKKEREENSTPNKRAVLKHDLYWAADIYDVLYEYQCEYNGFVSKNHVDNLSKDLSQKFEKVLDKGTTFSRYEYDGWCSDDGEVEGMDDEWAEEHLISPPKEKGKKDYFWLEGRVDKKLAKAITKQQKTSSGKKKKAKKK